MLLPVASPSMSGFTALRRAGHLRLPNEAEMSSLTLRLTSSPQQGSASAIAPTRACRATCRTGNLQGELLSVHKIGQACPGTTRVGQTTPNSALPRYPALAALPRCAPRLGQNRTLPPARGHCHGVCDIKVEGWTSPRDLSENFVAWASRPLLRGYPAHKR